MWGETDYLDKDWENNAKVVWAHPANDWRKDDRGNIYIWQIWVSVSIETDRVGDSSTKLGKFRKMKGLKHPSQESMCEKSNKLCRSAWSL